MCKYLLDKFLFQFERCKQELERVGQKTQKKTAPVKHIDRDAPISLWFGCSQQFGPIAHGGGGGGEGGKAFGQNLEFGVFIRAIEEEKNTDREEARCIEKGIATAGGIKPFNARGCVISVWSGTKSPKQSGAQPFPLILEDQ